ncbi:unnamed protein product, partial [marine sediment metagenome]
WTTVAATDHGVPSGASGVILHFQNKGAAGDTMGARMKGSNDVRTSEPFPLAHFMVMTGLGIGGDLDKFELYVGDHTEQIFELIGYTTGGVTFFADAKDKSTTTLNEFVSVDMSATCPNAIGIIIEYISTGYQKLALRKNGSEDDRLFYAYKHGWAIVGCDGSQIFQQEIDNIAMDIFVVGYITDGATFLTNATDISTATTGEWVDLTTLPEGAVIAFVEITCIGDATSYGLRKDGSAEDIYGPASCGHCWLIVEALERVIEGKIHDETVDFFLVGHAEVATGWTGKVMGVTNPAKVLGVAVADIAKVSGVA